VTERTRAGRDAFLACAIILSALAIRVGYGLAKVDYHVDEGITLAITNGTWHGLESQGLYERWMDKAELEEIVFNGKLRAADRVDFPEIAGITANDVHPPLFYWLIAIARRAVGVGNYVRACLLLNGTCFVFAALMLLATMRRARCSPRLTLLALALFAFSPAAVSLTRFIRMYELLELACMAFLCSACFALIPRRDGTYGASRVLAIAGLLLSSFIGLLTQYHFLLLVAPVSLVSAVVLAKRKQAATLLWCVLAVSVGLYAAWLVFPAMESHLFRSSRAAQSAANLLGHGDGGRLDRLGSFALLAIRSMPAVAAGLACGLYAIYTRARVRMKRAARVNARANAEQSARAMASSGDEPLDAISPVFFALLAVASVLTFVAVALSAPYRSLRYLVAFTPLYSMLGACVVTRVLPGRRGAYALLAALAVGIVPGLLPFNISNFHEDYVVDIDPSVLRDAKPAIIVSDFQGHAWKALLPYASLSRGKRVYVTVRDQGFSVFDSYRSIAARSGSEESYLLVDTLLSQPDKLEGLGTLGFFSVYRIQAE
jgi:hypothetical protein